MVAKQTELDGTFVDDYAGTLLMTTAFVDC